MIRLSFRPSPRRAEWKRQWIGGVGALGVAFALLLLLTASPDALARGSRFRSFATNPPRVGEMAPLFPAVDENGKKVHMKDFLGKTHLVLIFGALT